MKRMVFLLSLTLLFASCVSYENLYKLDSGYLERRQLETRRFETDNEDTMLVASAQVLQDLGFTLEESETKLGLITASKDRTAVKGGQVAGAVILSALFGGPVVYDTQQRIYATLVSTKSRDVNGFNVRIDFARIITNNQNNTRVELIQEPEIYQEFFDKLSQSLFLTAHNL